MSNITLIKSRFIHIPKCAGTYLQTALYYLCEVKKSYEGYPHSGHLCLHQLPEESYYNFTFIRHPYTWWPSYYHYMQRGMKAAGQPVPSFDDWFKIENPFWLGHYSTLIKRFIGVDDIYPTSNKINFVGKTENINEDLCLALQTADEPFRGGRKYEDLFKVPMIMNLLTEFSNVQQYDRGISDESKDLIYRGEKWVFETYGYTK